jgi:IS30 family transposase
VANDNREVSTVEVEAPTTNLWRQIDSLLQGHLAEHLAELHASGLSMEQVARSLLTEHGAIVSTRTIANWCRQLQIPGALAS